MYSGKSWSISVYSKYIQPAVTTTDGCITFTSFHGSGHICKCLFYTTPVSCLEIQIKKQCFAIFIYFGLVYAEGLNKNCMKLSQKKNYVWNLKTVQKTIDIGFKTIFTFKLKYLKTLPCVNLIKIKPTILNRFESR